MPKNSHSARLDRLIGSQRISHMSQIKKRALKYAEELREKVIESVQEPLWAPRVKNKPQQEAYVSPADRLFYGGAAGGG